MLASCRLSGQPFVSLERAVPTSRSSMPPVAPARHGASGAVPLRWALWASLALLVLLSAVAQAQPQPQAEAEDGDGVWVSLSGPGVPYAQVEHAIEARHGTVMVRVTKKFVNRFGHFDRVGLLGLDELGPLLARWFPPDAPPLTAPPPGPGAPAVLTLSWNRGGKAHSLRMGWPPAPGAIVAAERAREIQRAVEDLAGTVPYQDALLLPSESGRVRLRTTPLAWVSIDGVALPMATPIEEQVLTVGEHQVTFSPLDGSAPRTYPLKVVNGQLTALEVDLR